MERLVRMSKSWKLGIPRFHVWVRPQQTWTHPGEKRRFPTKPLVNPPETHQIITSTPETGSNCPNHHSQSPSSRKISQLSLNLPKSGSRQSMPNRAILSVISTLSPLISSFTSSDWSSEAHRHVESFCRVR